MPPALKVPFGKNSCPFCKVRKLTARALAQHCLEEVLNNVHFMCSRCGVSHKYKRRNDLRSMDHECWAKDYSFNISQMYYTVEGLKTLLANQGIRPLVVDKAITRIGYVHPRTHETLVDPKAEKTLVNPNLPAFKEATSSIGKRLLSLSG